MKCKCRDPKCQSTLYIDTDTNSIIVEKGGAGGMSILIYLDTNSINEMIRELKECLQKMEVELCVE